MCKSFSDNEVVTLQGFRDQLQGVYLAWMDSLDTKYFQGVAMARMFNSSYISGGCLPSLWNHELVNDWDFYFADKRAIELLVKYYTGPGIDDVVTFDSTYGKNKGIPIHEPLITNNAITIKNPLGSTIQLVIKYPNTSIKKITADFDYLHTTWYWSAKENQIWISRNILNSIEEKRLIINNQDNWNNKREEKFQGRGWLESDWRTRPPVSSSFNHHLGK